MSRSEEPYVRQLFQRVALDLRRARVLEIRFGLGISAGLIQQYLQPAEHHIGEIDTGIYADVVRFARQWPGVMAILGDWRCARLPVPFDFVFYDPFDYFGEWEAVDSEARLLRGLVGTSGVLCHPHFGDGPPRSLPGFRNAVVEQFTVPEIVMADGLSCNRAAKQSENRGHALVLRIELRTPSSSSASANSHPSSKPSDEQAEAWRSWPAIVENSAGTRVSSRQYSAGRRPKRASWWRCRDRTMRPSVGQHFGDFRKALASAGCPHTLIQAGSRGKPELAK
jgi:hypothetical protein